LSEKNLKYKKKFANFLQLFFWFNKFFCWKREGENLFAFKQNFSQTKSLVFKQKNSSEKFFLRVEDAKFEGNIFP